MKKIVFCFFIVVVLFFSILGCAVNSTTGGITVINKADKDAGNIKVGNVYIGTVGAGQSTYLYFFTAENDAKINIENFTTSYQGIIDLKLNYLYTLTLYKSYDTYIYSMSGLKPGDNNTSANQLNFR